MVAQVSQIEKSKTPFVMYPAFLGVLAMVFALSLWAMAPGITEGDAGELTGVAYTLGIAHLGYALYALIGKAFITLIPFASIPFRLTILSSVALCFCLFFMKQTVDFLTDGTACFWIVGPGLMLYAFSGSVWQQMLSPEVYALNLMLTMLWVWVILHPNLLSHIRLGLLFALLGLGVSSHHLSLLWVIPWLITSGYGFIYRKFTAKPREAHRSRPLSPALIALQSLVLMLTLSTLLYLPIRASRHVPWNWNYPDTWHRFFSLLSAESFRAEVMFSLTPAQLMKRLEHFFLIVWHNGFSVIALLAICGLLHAVFKKKRKQVLLTLSFVAVELIYCLFLNEAPLEVTPFTLWTTSVMYLWALYALCIAARLFDKKSLSHTLVQLLLFIPVPLLILLNPPSITSQDDLVAQHFITDVNAALSTPCLLIVEKDELFPLFYAQSVEHACEQSVIAHYFILTKWNEWAGKTLLNRYPHSGFINYTASLKNLDFMRKVNLLQRKYIVAFTFTDVFLLHPDMPYAQRGLLYFPSTRRTQSVRKNYVVNQQFMTTLLRGTAAHRASPSSQLQKKYALAYLEAAKNAFYIKEYHQAKQYLQRGLRFAPHSSTIQHNLAIVSRFSFDP